MKKRGSSHQWKQIGSKKMDHMGPFFRRRLESQSSASPMCWAQGLQVACRHMGVAYHRMLVAVVVACRHKRNDDTTTKSHQRQYSFLLKSKFSRESPIIVARFRELNSG